MKRPSFQFYPADWRTDAALQACGLPAQGLWVNLICIAHECVPYGNLVLNGVPMDSLQLARLIGIPERDFEKILRELLAAGVASRDEKTGAIFSRRMVRDERLRAMRAEVGRLGGNPVLLSRKVRGEVNQTDNPADNQTRQQRDNQNLTPSSSSSSSIRDKEKEKEKEKGTRKRAPPAREPDRPADVAEQTWSDWRQLRVKKRAPITDTVLTEARREAGKANVSFDRFLAIWCARGSQGLQADWIKRNERGGNGADNGDGYGYETPADKAKRERIAEITGGLASRKPKPKAPEAPQQQEILDAPTRKLD